MLVTLPEKQVIKNTTPKTNKIIKKYTGEKLQVKVDVSQEIKDKVSNGEIFFEVWTNINEDKHHGYPIRLKNNELIKEIDLTQTGFYTLAIRYRHNGEEYWLWQTKKENFTKLHVHPSYVRKDITYNAFVRFFGQRKLREDGTKKYGDVGTFDDLKHKLDYIKSLGANILYLNPIHLIGELMKKTDQHSKIPSYMQPGSPYSIKDYKSIDPELAIDKDHSQSHFHSLSDPMKEFKELVDEAHKRDMKVYLDLVFNHTSHDSVLQRLHPEWFLYKEKIQSVKDKFIYPHEVKDGKPWGDPKHTFCPLDHGYWWWDAAQVNWEYMIPKAENEPPKNPTINEMWEYFKSIPKYWMKHTGVDGFRCDVAYRVPPKFWKECIEEATKYAKELHHEDKTKGKDVVFIAETYVNQVNELLSAGFTAAYGDYGNKLYTPLTLKGYLDYIYNKSGDHFPENSTFFIFPECHDFKRLPEKILGKHKDEKLAEKVNMSRWFITAYLPGMPMLFNGFEKLEWNPINLFSYSDINWEKDEDLVEFVKKTNKIRNKYPTLQTGAYKYVPLRGGLNDRSQIFSFLRYDENSTFLIVTNMDVRHEAKATLMLPHLPHLNFNEPYRLKDLHNKQVFERSTPNLFIDLKPGKSHLFKIE